MAEKLPRFSKEEVYKTEFDHDSYGERTIWMDAPDLLDDTEMLQIWKYGGEGAVSKRLYDKIQEASHLLGSTSTNGTKSEHSGVTSQETLKLRALLYQIKGNKQATSLVDPMTIIARDSTTLDRDIFIKKVNGLNSVARSRTPLFVGGWELGVDYSQPGPRPGFAARFRGAVPLVFSNGEVNLEPIVESIDGREGFLPAGIGIEGLYKVSKVATYTKKWLSGREGDITEEERQQSEADYAREEAANK